MKKILLSLLIFFFSVSFATAQFPPITVPQGGSGITAVGTGAIVIGSSELRLTSTYDLSVLTITATSTSGNNTFGNILPVDATSDIGALANRFANIFADTIDVNTLLINTVVSGNIDMGGFDITNGGTITAENFVATSTTATSTFAGGLNIDSGGFIYDFSTNQVGIGIVPAAGTLLHVNGKIRAETNIEFGGNNFVLSNATHHGTTLFLDIQNGVGGDRGISFTVGGSTKALLEGGGNFGIGTTSPLSRLHAETATGAVLTLSRFDTGVIAQDVWGAIEFVGNDGSTGGEGVHAKIAGYTKLTSSQFGNIGFYTRNKTNASLDERMTIDYAGNVGIGTSTPNETLDVEGVIRISDDGVNNPTLKFEDSNSSSVFSTIFDNGSGLWMQHTQSGGGINIVNSGESATAFRLYDGGSEIAIIWDDNANELQLMETGGNVGIGMANPVSLLNIYEDNSTEGSAAGLTIEQDGVGNANRSIDGVDRWYRSIFYAA